MSEQSNTFELELALASKRGFEDGIAEGSRLGASAVAKILTETADRLLALQWFHDEVLLALDGRRTKYPPDAIIELLDDPRYAPVRDAKRNGT